MDTWTRALLWTSASCPRKAYSRTVPIGVALLTQAIDKEESKVSVSDRKILLVLAKPEDAQGHWPRLLKGTGKTPNVKVP